jgi:hypothetical protein
LLPTTTTTAHPADEVASPDASYKGNGLSDQTGDEMGKVIASASMSLDGYIANDDNTIGHLFDWLQNGDVECRTATEGITFHLSPQSADYWRQLVSGLGALVCGRTLFDFTDGWGGRHTMDAPVVVVTHQVPQPGSTPTPMLRSTSSPTGSRWR